MVEQLENLLENLLTKIGYDLDIKNVKPKELLNACIESVVDTTHLEEILFKCLEKHK